MKMLYKQSPAHLSRALAFLFILSLARCTMNPDHFSHFPIIITPDSGDHTNVLDIVYEDLKFYSLISYQEMLTSNTNKYSVMKMDAYTGNIMWMGSFTTA